MVMSPAKVRLSLDVSPEMNELLEQLAQDSHVSKSDVLRKAILLMKVVSDAKKKGKPFGIGRDLQSLETEIVGI